VKLKFALAVRAMLGHVVYERRGLADHFPVNAVIVRNDRVGCTLESVTGPSRAAAWCADRPVSRIMAEPRLGMKPSFDPDRRDSSGRRAPAVSG